MIENDEVFRAFSITTCEALREIVDNARERMKHADSKEEHDFNSGYLCAFHRVITLIQQQAELYEINLNELNMDDLFETDLIEPDIKLNRLTR